MLQILPNSLLPGTHSYSGLGQSLTLQSPSDTLKTNIYIFHMLGKKNCPALLWNPLQNWPQGQNPGRELSDGKERNQFYAAKNKSSGLEPQSESSEGHFPQPRPQGQRQEAGREKDWKLTVLKHYSLGVTICGYSVE